MLTNGLNGLTTLSAAQTRSISAENPTGEKGKGGMATEGLGAHAARELGRGWKVSPAIELRPGERVTLAKILGPGVIQHIWCTCAPEYWRSLILRMYWDDEEVPSVETPLGDFFCNGWCERTMINSTPIAVMSAGGMNAYWPMPFRHSASIQIEYVGQGKPTDFFYQITYALTGVDESEGYFHAQWRRSLPLAYKATHTILDGVHGQGHYVGTYLAWQTNNGGWWGEGELKFFMDGDAEFPTICGTGTEDYFGGAWGFVGENGGYKEYTSHYLGFHQIPRHDLRLQSNPRFGLYRWHICDPIRFSADLRITVQALGWRSEGRYLPLRDDIASTAFWYQTEPHTKFPELPSIDELEVI